MLTNEMIRAFKIHKRLNFFLPRMIFIWDSSYKTLLMNPSYISWTIWGAGMFNALILATGHIYVLFCHFFFGFRENFRLTTMFVMIGGLICILTVLLTTFIILRHTSDLTTAYNQVHHLAHRMAISKD